MRADPPPVRQRAFFGPGPSAVGLGRHPTPKGPATRRETAHSTPPLRLYLEMSAFEVFLSRREASTGKRCTKAVQHRTRVNRAPPLSDRNVSGVNLPAARTPERHWQALLHSGQAARHRSPPASGLPHCERLRCRMPQSQTALPPAVPAQPLREPVHRAEPWRPHGSKQPSFERLAGGVNEIRLPRCSDIGAVEDPNMRSLHKVRSTLDPQCAGNMISDQPD